MSSTILITGAAGKTGQAVIKQLSQSGTQITAWVRSPEQKIAGVDHYVVGDLLDPTAWQEACHAVDKLYLIVPNMHPQEFEIGQLALEAARAAGITHVVYHSVLHPQTEDMPHHWQKLRVEEAILASRLPFTILQPTAYMQNLRPQIEAARESGRILLPYRPESRISLVDLNDVAAVVAKVLSSTTHIGATYELAGTPAFTQFEIGEMIAHFLNRPLKIDSLKLSDWEAQNAHLTRYARETLIAMFRYYDRYGLIGNPTLLTHLLERPPTTVSDWLLRDL